MPRVFLQANQAINTYIRVAASYALQSADRVIGVTDTSAARTMTLAPASNVSAGAVIWVKDESGNASANTITVATQGANLIDGAKALQITTNYGFVAVYATPLGYAALLLSAGGAPGQPQAPAPIPPPPVIS